MYICICVYVYTSPYIDVCQWFRISIQIFSIYTHVYTHSIFIYKYISYIYSIYICIHIYTYIYIYMYTWLIHMCAMTQCRCPLVLVGSLKLKVSFAEYSLFYRALLQKRPTILTSWPMTSAGNDRYSKYAWHNSFLCQECVARLNHMWRDATQSCVPWMRDTTLCVTQLLPMCARNALQDSIICGVTQLNHVCHKCATRLTHMGWLWLLDFLKL